MYVPPGHFYSPHTADADVRRALQWDTADDDLPGLNLAAAGQLAFAAQMRAVLAAPAPGPRYRASVASAMFGQADAAVYRAMLDQLRPRQVVEVGAGYSTALALDEADDNPGLSKLTITCIEPDTARLARLIADADRTRLRVLAEPVQDVGPAIFAGLRPGDVLFIDSTHVVKAGSDVLWLFLHVLPRLRAGVVVHVHDVFWPFEYPAQWLVERRDWTEAYLVRAFLYGNDSWEVLFFASWFWRRHPGLVPGPLVAERPGSIWIRKTR